MLYNEFIVQGHFPWNKLHAAAPGLVQRRLFLPGTEYLHLPGENSAEKQTSGALCFIRYRHIGKDFPLPEEVGEHLAHANVIIPNLFLRKGEICLYGQASPMFGRPALFACRLRCKVINNRVIPGIADNIQVGILIHDTHQVFFGIPAAHNGSNYLNGHCFVSLMLCVPVWRKQRIVYLAVPLGYRMWKKEVSKLELAASMVRQVMPEFSAQRNVIIISCKVVLPMQKLCIMRYFLIFHPCKAFEGYELPAAP